MLGRNNVRNGQSIRVYSMSLVFWWRYLVADESEAARQALMSEMFDAIESDRVRCEATENPLFAWHALRLWFRLNRAQNRSNDAPTPMPAWVEEYLDVAAARMADLANGQEYRESPQPYGDLSHTLESVHHANQRKRTLSPERSKGL